MTNHNCGLSEERKSYAVEGKRKGGGGKVAAFHFSKHRIWVEQRNQFQSANFKGKTSSRRSEIINWSFIAPLEINEWVATSALVLAVEKSTGFCHWMDQRDNPGPSHICNLLAILSPRHAATAEWKSALPRISYSHLVCEQRMLLCRAVDPAWNSLWKTVFKEESICMREGRRWGNKSPGTFVHYLKQLLFALSFLLSNLISKRQDFFY